MERTLIAALLLWGCANPLPPPGGPPDREPPFVRAVEPEPGTRNFSGRAIRIHFSEFVDRASVLSAIRLQPPAPMELSWDWWGKTLTIRLPHGLDSATTYVLLLGTEYRDLAGNHPDTAFSLVFSTGPELDRGAILGELLDPQPQGVYIWAYRLDGLLPDTLNPSHTPARYRTQLGRTGSFRLMGLPAGEYRLFAVRDQDGDGLYQEERDALGTTTHPIVVHADSPVTVRLRLGTPRDRTPPQLSDVRPVSQRRVWLEWSEPLDPASLRAEGFAFAESAGADTVAVRAAVQVPQRPTVVELVSERVLEPNRRYAVLVRPGSVRDTAGNVLVQAPQPLSFRPVPTPDTQAVRLWTVPGDSARGVGLDEVLELFADAAMDTAALECTVQTAQGVPVPIVQEAVQQNRWRIRPQQRWQPDEWHLLQLRWRTAAALDGRSLRDTLLRVAFRTLDPRTCGELRGELLDSLGCGGPYVLQLYDRAGKLRRRLTLEHPGQWAFGELPAGEYTLELFCDADGDGVYSAGNAFPFRFAERSVRAGPFEVKARWSLEGIRVVLPP